MELQLDCGLRRPLYWSFIEAKTKLPIIGADLLPHYGLLINLKKKHLVDSTINVTSTGSVGAAEVVSITPVQRVPTPPSSDHLFLLLEEFKSLFLPASALPRIFDSRVQHHIVTTGLPVRYPPRRLWEEARSTSQILWLLPPPSHRQTVQQLLGKSASGGAQRGG